MTPAERLVDIEASLARIRAGHADHDDDEMYTPQRSPDGKPERVVYFIRCLLTNYVKVGSTVVSINSRCTALQMGSPGRLVVERVMSGGLARERELSEQFEPQRFRGEWFDLSRETIASLKPGAVEWGDGSTGGGRPRRPPPANKSCPQCERVLPADAFYYKPLERRLSSWCRECSRHDSGQQPSPRVRETRAKVAKRPYTRSSEGAPSEPLRAIGTRVV